ncbi:MAG: YidB family protein [Anaeromyxobacteraceae bacterium]
MGLFDDVSKAVGGAIGKAVAGEGQGKLGQAVIQWLGSGGLPQLMAGFQSAGLDKIAASWIGKGTNLPINADQLQKVLGPDALGNIATQAGLAPKEAASQLTSILPGLVDKLSPDGALPEGGALAQGLGLLKKLL